MKEINSHEDLIQYILENNITMVSREAFGTVLRHFNSIYNIEGDIVECGVWRGGFSIFLSLVFKEKNIWVCDSYEGFQPLEGARHQHPTERHVPSYTHCANGPLAISLEEVQGYFKAFGLGDDPRIKYLKGFVKDALPDSGIEEISLLRVDVDAYSATLEVLEELYSKVKTGGYIIFDDSCLYESLDAIKYFFKANDIPYYLNDPVTDQKLDLNKKHVNNDSGFPSGCYIVKE